MKYLYIMFFAFICTISYSQDTIKYWFDTYFYEPDSVEITSLQYECINKEALKKVLNSLFKPENSYTHSHSIGSRVKIPFLKHATKIKTADGRKYYLHINAVNMDVADLAARMDIPDGTTVQTLYPDGSICQRFRDFNSKYDFGHSFMSSWNEIILEVTMPTGIKGKPRIEISYLYCQVTRHTKISLNKLKQFNSKETLNSCNNFITCMDNHEEWNNEHNGVFNIIIKYDIVGSSYKKLHATGFLLNTSTNYDYDLSNRPYAFTCHHFLNPIIQQDVNLNQYLKDNKLTFVQFHNFKLNCSDTDPMQPRWEPAYFSILEKGNWKKDSDLNEDYLFLQFGEDMDLHYICSAWNRVTLSGWRRYLKTRADYIKYPSCYIFHHDGSDVKFSRKYAIDNEEAFHSTSTPDLIHLNCDKGFTTFGASGAPIFSSTHHIIGMNLSGQNTCSDPDLQGNSGLSFSALWDKAKLERYLGDKEIVYSLNTRWENLPSHCNDCKYSYSEGETGLDCGGPCKPCKSFLGDVIDFKTFKSGLPANVCASNQISLSGTVADPMEINEN